jgi:hypothetical protein
VKEQVFSAGYATAFEKKKVFKFFINTEVKLIPWSRILLQKLTVA